jgi:DNA-binding CsgD family transcriptional regulator
MSDASTEFPLAALLESPSLRDALDQLVESGPIAYSISQAALFELGPTGDFLRAAGSRGLTANLERLYASLGTWMPSPVTWCFWAEMPLEATLMDIAKKYPDWAIYYDEYLSEGQYVVGRVLVHPLVLHGFKVGAIFLLVIGHEDLEALNAHLATCAPALAVLVAAVGYCRMWDPATSESSHVSSLSVRDRQLLLQVEQGLSNKQIARKLSEKLSTNVSESLVRNSLTRIFRSLGATNRNDAVKKARLRGDLAGLR